MASPSYGSPPVIRPKGPFKIERGTSVYLRLKFEGFKVEPPEEIILWEGEIGTASIMVGIPLEIKDGMKTGLVTIHWDGGLQIARVPIQIHIVQIWVLA